MIYVQLLLIGFIGLAILSFFKVKGSKDKVEFIYKWAWVLGAFVWEDLLAFSILGALITGLVLLTSDIRVGFLGFLVFWIVRSAGETVYFFLQQFSHNQVYPHNISNKFDGLRVVFGKISDQKCYILLQIWHQCIVVFSLTLLILLLMSWDRLPVL